MAEKMLLIANPTAGMRRVRRMLPKIKSLFEENGYEIEAFETSARGDAAEAVKKFAEGQDIVVCAGGDGTLNETLTGLMSLENRPPLGYIPAGSTNDFAAGLGLPSDIMKAAANILTGGVRELDVGKIGERYFSYVASFGAFTEASYMTPQSLKNTLGHLAYILEGAKDLANIRPHHVRIEADGETYEENYLFGAVLNATSLGGLVRLNKEVVDFSDGLFELMLVKNPKNMVELSKIIISLQSQKYDTDVITFLHAQEVGMEMDAETPWSLDGEYFKGGESLRITNLHNAIKFVTK